jgi:hypothetical protein
MTAAEKEPLARFETFDGCKWHVLDPEESIDAPGEEEPHAVALCGAHAPESEFTDEAPTGEYPDELTDETICYGCVQARREK